MLHRLCWTFFFFPKEIIFGPRRTRVYSLLCDFMVSTSNKLYFYSFQGYSKGMRSTFSPDFPSCTPFNTKALSPLLLSLSSSTMYFVSQVQHHVSVGKLGVGIQTWKTGNHPQSFQLHPVPFTSDFFPHFHAVPCPVTSILPLYPCIPLCIQAK